METELAFSLAVPLPLPLGRHPKRFSYAELVGKCSATSIEATGSSTASPTPKNLNLYAEQFVVINA